jgi:hypothetical protein
MAQMTTYKPVFVEIGKVSFVPIEARYVVQRGIAPDGNRMSGDIKAYADIWIDAHDVNKLSQDDAIELWKLATETKNNPHKVSITYYTEDGDRVLSNAEFQGWISDFVFYNPGLDGGSGEQAAQMGGHVARGVRAGAYNNILYLHVVANLREDAIGKHKFTK